LHLVDTATAHGLETRVQAGVEHVVVAVVAETVNFGLLVLEVHEGRDYLRVDPQGVDEL
jgi:hypothetical protein